MTENLLSTSTSLARAFEPERRALLAGLGNDELTPAQIVSEARRALDRTGASYTESVSDPKLQKAGLWLLEMIKTGAGVLDQGARAEIVWQEIAPVPDRKWIGQAGFYSAAGILATYAFLEQSRLAFISISVLTIIRLLDRDNLKKLKEFLPFGRKAARLEDKSGKVIQAEARLLANVAGYVDAIANAVKTADHILLRLAEPEDKARWHDDPRLMTLVQGLLEAAESEDGDFALKLVGKELTSILQSEGIARVEYSKKSAAYFDVLPGIGLSKPKLAAPALEKDGEIIRRGTVWGPDNG